MSNFMEQLKTIIENAFEHRAEITPATTNVQLSDAINQVITQLDKGQLVSAQPLENRPDSLNVFLTAFHGRYDGKVIIQGNGIYKSDKVIIKRDFSLLLDQDENGYSALVRTLARGWIQVGQSIASQLS